MSALNTKYYKAHLEKVSRSFAFCIAELREDLQSEVALAYLMFRVLDTIEDSEWSSNNSQKNCFELFLKLIDNKKDVLEEFTSLLLTSKSKKEEADLVRDSRPLFDCYWEMPDKRRTPLNKALKTMTQGMEYFALEKKHQIKNISELDQYCYYVAGCIGELLTEWTFQETPQDLMKEAVHFGLFLQKINILKDFLDDSKAGRNFLWSWQDVANTLPLHAKEAFQYIEKIETQRNDYKVFCAWSFFLGLLSYPSIEKSLKTSKVEKISRLEAWQMLNVVKKNILNKNELKLLFDKLSIALPQTS